MNKKVTRGSALASCASQMKRTKSSTQRIQTLRNTAEIFVEGV